MNNSVVLLEQTTNSFKKISQRQLRFVVWELIPFGTLSWRGLNPVKLVYDPDSRMAGSVLQPVPTVLVAGPTAAQHSRFSSLAVVITIAKYSLCLPTEGWPG